MKSLKEARARTGRNLAVAVKAGKFIVREVTKIHRNGTCDLTELTGWQGRGECAEYLRTL